MDLLRLKTLVWIIILAISASIFTCCSRSDKDNSRREMIENLVKDDLKDGASANADLELDIPGLPSKKYVSDREHSSISFKTGHWEIVDIKGWFNDFDIIMYSDASDFSDAVIYGTVNPASIQMPNEKMAGSAQNEPYIDSENFPEVTFMSTNMEKLGNNRYELHGSFEMNGIKKEMILQVQFNGFAYPGEKSICGFTITGKINRNDFKVGGQDLLHSGRKVHSDTIYLDIALRME